MKQAVGSSKKAKDKAKERKTPKELFSVSDADIMGNWTSLASFISHLEGVKWDDAKREALRLLEEDKAAGYLATLRQRYTGEKPTVTKEPVAVKTETSPQANPSPQNISKIKNAPIQPYSGNYKRLLKIAPGLEERLLSGEEVYGKSSSAGYMDVSLELLEKESGGKYHMAIAHYFSQGGDLVPDPDMRILVDIENQIVEALTFQNSLYYVEVYDDPYNRDKMSITQKRNQNAHLTTWLTNLIRQSHKIQWRETEDQTFPFESTPSVTYKTQDNNNTKQDDMNESDNNPPVVDVEETAKHWKKLASAIRQAEGISQEKADAKAQKLKQQGKAESYLMELLSSKSQNNVKELLKANYKRLTRFIPEINKRARLGTVDGVLKVSGDKSYMVYELIPANGPKQAGLFFGINETNHNKQVENGSMVIAIHPLKHIAQVMLMVDGFHFSSDYDSTDHDLSDSESYKANKQLADWLDQIMSMGYEAQWNDKQAEEDKPDKIEEEKEQPESEPIEEKQEENIQKEKKKKFPPLRPQKMGRVKLKPQHINAGLTQDDIDWINKHKQGMVITPRKNPVNNTKNLEMDMALQAKRPGFRISATGMLYYEGRSNRSDLTDYGL